MSKEIIKEGIKRTTLTAEEWYETINLYGESSSNINRPVFRYRPPKSCSVIYDPDRNVYNVFSLEQ